jgi:hypothetical protein
VFTLCSRDGNHIRDESVRIAIGGRLWRRCYVWRAARRTWPRDTRIPRRRIARRKRISENRIDCALSAGLELWTSELIKTNGRSDRNCGHWTIWMRHCCSCVEHDVLLTPPPMAIGVHVPPSRHASLSDEHRARRHLCCRCRHSRLRTDSCQPHVNEPFTISISFAIRRRRRVKGNHARKHVRPLGRPGAFNMSRARPSRTISRTGDVGTQRHRRKPS